jgi:hypothetical protein
MERMERMECFVFMIEDVFQVFVQRPASSVASRVTPGGKPSACLGAEEGGGGRRRAEEGGGGRRRAEEGGGRRKVQEEEGGKVYIRR